MNSVEPKAGLAAALEITRGGARPELSDGVAKVLKFCLHDGECDVVIKEDVIEIRFSWLDRRKPSPYFIELAPGLVAQLMNFGNIAKVEARGARFRIGPDDCGCGLYQFTFGKKWISIVPAEAQILIRVRAKKSSLASPLRSKYDG